MKRMIKYFMYIALACVMVRLWAPISSSLTQSIQKSVTAVRGAVADAQANLTRAQAGQGQGFDLTSNDLVTMCAEIPKPGNLKGKETAILVVDMQVCFCGTALYDKSPNDLSASEKDELAALKDKHKLSSAENRKPIQPIQALLARARAAGATIAYTRDCHVPRRDWREFCRFGFHCLCNDDSSTSVVPELAPRSSDIIIKKPNYDAFFNTNLHDQLQAKKIKNLVVVGVLANVCVYHSAAHGGLLGYNVIVPGDCTAGIPSDVPTFEQSLTKAPGELLFLPHQQGKVTHWDAALWMIRWLFGNTVANGTEIQFT